MISSTECMLLVPTLINVAVFGIIMRQRRLVLYEYGSRRTKETLLSLLASAKTMAEAIPIVQELAMTNRVPCSEIGDICARFGTEDCSLLKKIFCSVGGNEA